MAKTETKTDTIATPKPQAAHEVSVVQLAKTQPRYILEISRSEDKNAVDPVFISNGDYQCTLRRGVPVVVPECIVSVLRDAITGIVDPQTKEVTDVPSYPYQAVPYEGDEPVGTVMNLRTMKAAVTH